MNDYTLSNINAANHAQTCPHAEASVLAKTFRALEKQTAYIPGYSQQFGAIAAAFEARVNEVNEANEAHVKE